MQTGELALGPVTFAQPLLLLGLVLCLLPLLPRPKGVAAWLRGGAIALAVLALAGPTIGGGRSRLAVVVDVSDSVGDTGLARASGLAQNLPSDTDFVLAASEATRVASLPTAAPRFLTPGGTDLARAIQVASAGGADRVLLVSDGVAPEADTLAALPDVPVDVVHVPSRSGVGLAELILPTQVAPGQAVEAVAVVRSDVATTVRIAGVAGGTDLEPVEVNVEPGTTAVPLSFTAGQGSVMSVSVDLFTDVPAGATTLSRELSVRTRPPILVVGDAALAAALTAQGLDVRSGTYSAIALRGGAADFTPGQLDLLAQFVQTGGGLLMTGGPESFGFGGWYRTPVEEILPVTTDLRTEVTLPLVALVMVVDRSQSMATGSPSKIELAKEGAIQVVELAYQEDLLGLIAFSDEASTRWVFELRPATERGDRVHRGN